MSEKQVCFSNFKIFTVWIIRARNGVFSSRKNHVTIIQDQKHSFVTIRWQLYPPAVNSIENRHLCLVCLLTYSQCLEPNLGQSGHLINTCWIINQIGPKLILKPGILINPKQFVPFFILIYILYNIPPSGGHSFIDHLSLPPTPFLLVFLPKS